MRAFRQSVSVSQGLGSGGRIVGEFGLPVPHADGESASPAIEGLPVGSVHPDLQGRTCYHRYEISPGLYTPGTFLEVEPARCLDELGVPRDLTGCELLEIGAWDGAFTFELVRRGAHVTALDIQDPDVTVFNAVRKILDLPVNYLRLSIYDLEPQTHGRYDAVVFSGIYYHLKNPLLALQKLRSVLRDGGQLYIEGASCSDYLGKRLSRDLPWVGRKLLTRLIDRLPVSVFDAERGIYPGKDNWWFPTSHCLRLLLEDSGFTNVKVELATNAFYRYSHRRLMGTAVADDGRPDPGAQALEHEVFASEFNSDHLQRKQEGGQRGLLRRLARRMRRFLG